jgi:hypothetical protein
MLLELRSVSRKTPLDGKLEITPTSAARLSALGPEFMLATGGQEATGRLHVLACTCAKAAGASHVHHFLESPALRALLPGAEVRIELDEAAGTVRVEAV